MPNFKRANLSFWIATADSLKEIANKLKADEIIRAFTYDYENVYEWVEGPMSNRDRQLNISRKHCDWNPPPDEPVQFLVLDDRSESPDDDVRHLAKECSRALRLPVNVGVVHYLGNDEFRYDTEEVIAS